MLGKPTQNAYIERFDRTFRTEVLDRYVFTSLGEVRRMAEDSRHRYNHHRPHHSLSGLTPIHYAMAQSPSTSTFEGLEQTRTLQLGYCRSGQELFRASLMIYRQGGASDAAHRLEHQAVRVKLA